MKTQKGKKRKDGLGGKKGGHDKGASKPGSTSQISLKCMWMDEPMLAAGSSETGAFRFGASAGERGLLGGGK